MSGANGTAQDEPKKRRRQNVACDTCKLRRVKCDLSVLLCPSDPASSSAMTLSDMVRAHPEVECTNCKSKAVKCTTQQILQPTKPMKGGRRIDEAKRLFGAGERGSNGPEQRQHNASQAHFDQSHRDSFQAFTGTGPDQILLGLLLDGSSSTSSMSNTFGETIHFPYELSQPQPNLSAPNDNTQSSAPPTFSIDDWDSDIPSEPDSQGIIQTALSETDRNALSTWRLLAHESLSVSTASTPSGGPKNSTPTTSDRLPPPQVTLFRPTQTLPVGPPVRAKTPQPKKSFSPYSFQPDQLTVGRKRVRSDSPFSSATKNAREDLWRFWADREIDALARDAVQERLATRTLGVELSRHLVKSYFNCVHMSFPALSPEGFYLEWERAGQQSDLMIASHETLCAVMEAWGARFSDSPVVLGLSRSQAHLAPKVHREDGTLIPGSQARALWGKARLTVCNALVERARKMIDTNGILRKPSLTGLQAILLYSQLLHMSDDNDTSLSRWMENQMVQSTILEQMKLLNLLWDSTGEIPTEQGAIPLSAPQARMSQRRLFWSAIVMDAFACAADGEMPRVPEEELESVGRFLDVVEDKLPTSTFKTLAFFLRCYHTLSMMARTVARRITGPNKKPGTVDVSDFVSTIRDLWTRTFKIMKDMTYITQELLEQSENSLLGFSPLSYITNLRLSCPFILLVIHQSIRDQLDFRQSLVESFIYDTNTGSGSSQHPPGPQSEAVKVLEELHKEGVDVLLHTCRSHINMFKVLLPTGTLQAGALCVRVLIATSQFLAEVPTNEQGYSSNTGGYGWTWANKQAEVDICIQSLHQLGWAWADVADVLDSVHLAMERTRPTDEEINGGKNSCPGSDPRLVVAKLEEDAAEARLLSALMRFWPPRSVPSIIQVALEQLRVGKPNNGELSEKSRIVDDNGEVSGIGIPSDSSFPYDEKRSSMMDHLQRSLGNEGVYIADLSSAAQVAISGSDARAGPFATTTVDRSPNEQTQVASTYVPLAFDQAIQAIGQRGNAPLLSRGQETPQSFNNSEGTYSSDSPLGSFSAQPSSHTPSHPAQPTYAAYPTYVYPTYIPPQALFQLEHSASHLDALFNDSLGSGAEAIGDNAGEIELLLRNFTESTPSDHSSG